MPVTELLNSRGAIHSTKISGNFGPKLNGSVRSNRKSFEKTGPRFEVDHFSRSDWSEFWGAIHSTKIFNSYRNIIVYPLDMCIPVHIFLVICVSLQYDRQKNVCPLPPQNWRVYFFDLLRRP